MGFFLDIPIVFISTQRTNASENLFPQTHEYYELNYLTRGRTKINLNGLAVPYEAHDFVLVPPGIQHNLYSSKEENYRNYTICFTGNAEFLSSLIKEDQAILFHDYDGSVNFLVSEILRLYNSNGMQDAEVYNAYLYAVLMHLRRGTVLDAAASLTEKEDPVEKAVRFINDHVLQQPVTVSIVADAAGLSPAHFTRLFQNKIGIAPVKYIIEVKMNYAKRMLVEQDLSIKEIARLLHYEDQLYFSRQFTKCVGMSPRKYRNESRR
ncbi:MAG: AraC family transcriptional regulator [Eubacteriales bacterium]|nr:AraC family transcriptional regulator [Eubacteriales bacterium]